MPTKLDNFFGLHATALALHSQRARVLATNLSNVDTPNYKARDLDFRAVLAGNMGASVNVTHSRHINNSPAGASSNPLSGLLYRNPQQASLDGNTVDSEVEQAQFSENAIRYQTSLKLLDGKVKGLMRAMREN